MKLFVCFFLWVSCVFSVERMKVASLHPLMTDLLRQIGGKQIVIVEIGKEGFNVHEFQPDSKDIRALQDCQLVVASGKGIEVYLPDLKDSLSKDQEVIEVGKYVPTQEVDPKSALYACCPAHANSGSSDPHWWHNASYMARAAKSLGKELGKHDEKYKDLYKQRGQALSDKYRDLDKWVKSEVLKIDKKNRHLVTAHAAFGYFCDAYGFKASYVKGLSAKAEISAKDLANSIRNIKDEKIPAVFPEVHGNRKMIQQIAKEVQCKVGEPLTADGHYSDYEKMIRSNVSSIVDALKR